MRHGRKMFASILWMLGVIAAGMAMLYVAVTRA
jgi:hypothetical protein